MDWGAPPADCLSSALTWLDQAYGQLSTTGPLSQATARTVHFQRLGEEAVFIVNTHIGSEKWHHLKRNPQYEGCVFKRENGLQVRFAGQAVCVTHDHDPDLCSAYWHKMREEVREAYVRQALDLPLDGPDESLDLSQPTANHAILRLNIEEMLIFQLSDRGYRFGTRMRLLRQGKNQWEKQELGWLPEHRPASP